MTQDERFKVLSDSWFFALSPHTVGVHFECPKLVLSDASWNGGWLPECMGVINHQMHGGEVSSAAGLREYCQSLLKRHSFSPETPLQLTCARVLHGGLSCEEARGLLVSVFASAGIHNNAVWAGDPASYEENPDGDFFLIAPGTINVMVFVQAQLGPAVLPRIFTIVAEVKADLLRERRVRSCYSSRIATGTGTDSTVVVSDSHPSRRASTASTHSLLGTAIARAARTAIAQALDRD
jgi:adenosylcobinamide amidohydrolase